MDIPEKILYEATFIGAKSTVSQLALAAARLVTSVQGYPHKEHKTIKQSARDWGIAPSAVEKAAVLLKTQDREAIVAVERGEMTAWQALGKINHPYYVKKTASEKRYLTRRRSVNILAGCLDELRLVHNSIEDCIENMVRARSPTDKIEPVRQGNVVLNEAIKKLEGI